MSAGKKRAAREAAPRAAKRKPAGAVAEAARSKIFANRIGNLIGDIDQIAGIVVLASHTLQHSDHQEVFFGSHAWCALDAAAGMLQKLREEIDMLECDVRALASSTDKVEATAPQDAAP